MRRIHIPWLLALGTSLLNFVVSPITVFQGLLQTGNTGKSFANWAAPASEIWAPTRRRRTIAPHRLAVRNAWPAREPSNWSTRPRNETRDWPYENSYT